MSTLAAAPSAQPVAQPTPDLVRDLYYALLCSAPARRSWMQETGPKYLDTKHHFGIPQLRAHLDGAQTYAVTLAHQGQCVSACRDYDSGGEPVLLAALAALASQGVTGFAISMPGDEHPGGHVWVLYSAPVPVGSARAHLSSLPGEAGEIYPSGNCIRLPLGYHVRKQSFGVLLLPDGERIPLDTPEARSQALRRILALPRNAPPLLPPVRSGDTAPAPAAGMPWEPGEQMIDGEALLASPRYQKWIQASGSKLGQLLRGEREVYDPWQNDSDSLQIACVVRFLMTRYAPPTDEEIAAVALVIAQRLTVYDRKEALRHISSEITRYRSLRSGPGSATLYLRPRPGDPEIPALPVARPRGRPASESAQLDALRQALAGLAPDASGRIYPAGGVSGLAARLGVQRRRVQQLLAALRQAGEITTGTTGGRGATYWVCLTPGMQKKSAGSAQKAAPGVQCPDAIKCADSATESQEPALAAPMHRECTPRASAPPPVEAPPAPPEPAPPDLAPWVQRLRRDLRERPGERLFKRARAQLGESAQPDSPTPAAAQDALPLVIIGDGDDAQFLAELSALLEPDSPPPVLGSETGASTAPAGCALPARQQPLAPGAPLLSLPHPAALAADPCLLRAQRSEQARLQRLVAADVRRLAELEFAALADGPVDDNA